MDDDVELLERHALGAAVLELPDVVGRREVAREPARRVVVAADPHHLDVRVLETLHLFGEEQSRRVVTPATVEQVAGNQEKPRPLGDRELDQASEGVASRTPKLADGRPRVALEAAQGAVEMQVRGVNQLRHAKPLSPGRRERTPAPPKP